jgi:23S rRNA (cytosine1962-C5)-methyltransferase
MAIPPDLSSAGEETAVLVDFGQGRRLERLAGVLVDRPLPQARLPRRLPGLWAESALTYTGGPEGESRIPAGEQAPPLPGGWRQFRPLPDPWRVAIPLHVTTLHLEVRPAASGQTGLFLEQAPQWTWLERVTSRGARILSLFAHSGAATLALAAAGAEVVHVDASRQAIGLARRNADASGLGMAPIRFVCEDARVFVQRELRRGSRYDGVVLDPPSWGHGPKGQAFAIDRDLPLLLDDLAGLVPVPAAGPLLLSCHSAGWTARRLAEGLAVVAGKRSREITSGPLTCSDASGRSLEFGAHARLATRPDRKAL